LGILEGQVAIVTGGANGIGAACCELFVREGAHVIIADVDDRGSDLAEKLSVFREVKFVHTDVGREDDVRHLVQVAEREFGRLDCMLNNAAISGTFGGIEHVSLMEFDQVVNVVLRGVFLGMQCAAPMMKRQKSGSIINMASVAGFQAGYGGHVYSATKSAVMQLTRTVAMELGEHGIRVNSICPGAVATQIFGKAIGLSDELANANELLMPVLARSQPIPRACTTNDIAEAAVWFASDASGFINGHSLTIDGGMTGGMQWSAGQKIRDQIRDALTRAGSLTR
jgi:NAD(P)-dependent dehydrogenase (short-subunit alcohol dehydrogenase family)